MATTKKKTTYIVNLLRTVAQTVEIEAESVEQAYDIANEMVEDGKIEWSLENLTDDVEVEVSGQLNENGEEVF